MRSDSGRDWIHPATQSSENLDCTANPIWSSSSIYQRLPFQFIRFIRANCNEGESGPFTIKVPFTPRGGGTLLVCAYSEYVTDDAAWASTEAVVTGGAPTNTVKPRLTRHGARLTCARGSWGGQPSSYSYRWRLNGKTSPDKQNTLTLSSTQHGSAVCTVTAKNASGSKSASSRPLKLV